MTDFEWILKPRSVDEFLSTSYNKRAVLLREPTRSFADLFGWEKLNAALNAAPAVHPTVRLTKHEKKVPVQDSIDIINQVRDGATLIFEHLDRYDAMVGRLADSVSADTCEDTRVNLYLSCPQHFGFLRHYDTQDVFVLQIEGVKRWRVWEPTVEAPLFFQKTHGLEPPSEDSKYLDVEVRPGDVLYIPRGHWHDALAQTEPTIHLTLSVFVRTGIDFFAWLINELREHPEFRRSLPFVPAVSGNRGAWATALADEAGRLGEVLAEHANDSRTALAFDQHRVATQRDRGPFRFPHHFGLGADEILAATCERSKRPCLITPSETEGGGVDLTVRGLVLHFPSGAEAFLSLVFSSSRFVGAALAASVECPEPLARSVLRTLVIEGLITVVGSDRM